MSIQLLLLIATSCHVTPPQSNTYSETEHWQFNCQERVAACVQNKVQKNTKPDSILYVKAYIKCAREEATAE